MADTTDNPAYVTRLPSRAIQLQAIPVSASGNNGDYTELIALCEDGSMWLQYHSNGYANVPTHNGWYQIHEMYIPSQPVDEYLANIRD